MKYKFKFATVALLSTALAAAPLSSANAYGWHHHGGGGPGWGLLAGVAAVTGAAVAVATLPFRAVGEIAAPAPVYAAPAPAYYGGYYAPAPQQQVVYAYPQGYPAPAYYAYPRY